MKDSEIIKTIYDILVQLHDPKNGINGHANELRAQNLSDKEYDKARADKLNEIVDKYDLTPDDGRAVKIFRMTGADVVDHKYTISCGHWAKAVCYLNSLLPDDKRLELRVMMSTEINHLSDGKVCHTVPCVRMADGKWHAFEPQNNPAKTGRVDFLSEEIAVNKTVEHLREPMRGHRYKIVAIITPEYYETELCDFERALKVFKGEFINDKMKTATANVAHKATKKLSSDRITGQNHKSER